MKLRTVVHAEGSLELRVGRVRVADLGVHVFGLPDLTPAEDGWHTAAGQDRWGTYTAHSRIYLAGGEPVLRFTVRNYGTQARTELLVLRHLKGLKRGDALTSPCLLAPQLRFPPELQFLACTYGLDGGRKYPGGYWPSVVVGQGPDELPAHAFAPFVLFDGEAALALAPADFFLTSAFVRIPGGAGRGLHGRVGELPAGTRISTWLAIGENPFHALANLGNLLLAEAGKARAGLAEHPLFSRLGYWNAYGSYYSEPLHPMDGKTLQALARSFREARIPVGYFGLDLWYPYETIGRAKVFRPDPRKYPHGLGRLGQETGIPYVLHLSALAEENAYGESGAEPELYRLIAEDAKSAGAIAIWHDWLRTWQHLTPRLREDPVAAERWFSGMARAFAEQGLPVVLCMQTMGMVLAATQEPNVVAARSHTDFLFAQQGALQQAAKKDPGFLREATPSHILWQRNLLMGAVLWSLGLRPFHDLFLTRRHPGFGGEHPVEEALLRALSCGPVGFGDKLGLVDARLLGRLVLADGRLAQPDHPPLPDPHALTSEVQLFWTERRSGETRWLYLLALNPGEETACVPIEPPVSGDWLVWKPAEGEPFPLDRVSVSPQSLVVLVLAPRQGGIAPVGFRDLLVPAPARGLVSAHWDGHWELELHAPVDPVLLVGKIAKVRGLDGQKVRVVRRGDTALCYVGTSGRIVVEGR